MKAELDSENDRILVLQDMDVKLTDLTWQIDTFRLKLDYDGDTGVGNAKVLDRYVIPKLLSLLQLEEHLWLLYQLAEENILTEQHIVEAENDEKEELRQSKLEQEAAVLALEQYLNNWCER